MKILCCLAADQHRSAANIKMKRKVMVLSCGWHIRGTTRQQAKRDSDVVERLRGVRFVTFRTQGIGLGKLCVKN